MYRTWVHPPNEKRLSLLVFLGPHSAREHHYTIKIKADIYEYEFVGYIYLYSYIKYRTWVHPPNEKRLSLLVFLGPPSSCR